MKKLVLCLVVVVTITSASFGQGVSFGVKAGVNFAKQAYESDGISVSLGGATAFHVGGFVTAMISDKVGIQPELLFSQTGSKLDLGGFGIGELKQTLSYLTVPVMVRYNVTENINLHAGPQLGFLMSAKAKIDGESEDIKEGFKGADFGFALGAGYDLPAGLGFSARYVVGLSDIASEDVAEPGVKITNRVFQISVSYRFGGAGD